MCQLCWSVWSETEAAHLCGTPERLSHAFLPCEGKSVQPETSPLVQASATQGMDGAGQTKPSSFPSELILQCFVRLCCSSFLCGLQGSPRILSVRGSLIIIIDLFAGTDAGVSHLAILLTLLCRSQMHISFLFFKFPFIFQLRLTFNVSGIQRSG